VQPVRGAEVVDAGDARAQLEAQVLVVAQRLGHAQQVLAGDVQRQLTAVDDDLADRVTGRRVRLVQGVHDLVEVRAVRTFGRRRRPWLAHEAAEAGGVTGVLHAEHALALDAVGLVGHV
jgi:hypothetical protein